MTEAEWLGCACVRTMLQFLRYQAPADPGRGRKYRLFACACARRAAGVDDVGREAVSVAERFADRRVDAAELRVARQSGARGLARKTLLRSARMAATDAAYMLADGDPLLPALLRDVMGNPYRPVRLDSGWRTCDVVDLAREIYQDRAFERMPLLTAALAEAGCEDEAILGHGQGDGPHVRGCWVVDLALGLA